MTEPASIQISGNKALQTRLMAISASFIVGAALMAVKFYAYRLTHSSAILSDALESIINVVASAFAAVSIVFSAIPPDENHPYGHGKIEFFSSGFEGALIVIAAAGIFASGISHMLDPHRLPHLKGGLLLLLGTAAVNLILGMILVRVGKKTASLTVTADGQHVLADVYTSGGVVLGLFLVHATGWYWMDGLIACIVGIHVLVIGFQLVRTAFSGLMDASDTALLEEVSGLIRSHRQEKWIDIHQLRALRSGNLINIDLHLILPRHLTLEEAHAEGNKLERILIDHFGGNARALIHLDPCEDPDCPDCADSTCDLRSAEKTRGPEWDLRFMRRFKVRAEDFETAD